MKRFCPGICAVLLLAVFLVGMPVYGSRPTDFGKQWGRSHPFQLFGWTVQYADYLYTATGASVYKGCGLNSALLPYPYATVAAAEARGMSWHGQLFANELDANVTNTVNAISSPADDNGWYITDDPGPDQLPGVGRVADWLRTNRPNSLIYVNLTSSADVDQVMATVNPDLLMYDSYPFRNNGTTDMNRHFDNLMKYRNKGLQYGVPYWSWMQAFTSMTENYVRKPSESELRMQVFSSLAAGYKGLGYFIYDSNDPAGYEGLVLGDNSLDPLYYAVEDMNREAAHLGKSLRYLTSTDVRYIQVHNSTPTGLTNWSAGAGGDSHITNITANAGQYAPYKDGLIGFFTDDVGEKYFMLTNLYHDPNLGSADTALSFTVSFDSSVNELLRLNRETGEQEVVPLINHALSVSLPGGSGDLFKYSTGIPFASDDPTIGATVNFWFASAGDPTGTPISSINVASGSSFNVSVWYRTNEAWPHNALELLVGYDQSTSKGASAIPTLGKITASAAPASSIGAVWAYTLANNLGGGNGSGARPYGAHLAVAATLGADTTATAAQRICDVTLTNAMPAGDSNTMTIWNNLNFSSGWTSFIAKNQAGSVYGPAATLTVNSVAAAPIAIDDAKKRPDGASVSCSGIVTASLNGFFYIETPERSSGIRVSRTGYTAVVGNMATVAGTMGTLSSGERQIEASSVDEQLGTALNPLGMNNKTLGGADFGAPPAGQSGVAGGAGVNNIGLLVTTTGHVSGGSGNSFNIDDGSGVPVKATVGSGGIPSNGSYVQITGISSCEKPAGEIQRLILVTSYQILSPP